MPAQFPEAAGDQPQPQPQRRQQQQLLLPPPTGATWNSDDEVVISGSSGRFPECSNLQQLREQLLAAADLITEDDRRYPVGLHGLPSRSGKLGNIHLFDATFFGIHPKQAESMDPQIRMMLELTYEAIVDAGVNPQELRGSRTGVFVGSSGSETYNFHCSDPDKVNGYGLSGCGGAMFANFISFAFDFKGPSFSLDTACSSSMLAFHQAVVAIRTGQCDAAIVGGVSLALSSTNALQFQRLRLLSPDGKCKAFDASGDGYVRSEAAVIMFLQKRSASKRVYATVVHTKINTDGFKEQGVMFPSGQMQKKLIQEVFQETGINPADVAYVEAHGTGTMVGDPQELNTVAEVFCKDRTSPLPVGSIKSNMGHSEPASGLCSIAKVLIAMETGVIPPNLHYKEPNPHIPALVDGRIKVVTEPLPWNGGLVSINSFGFGGANGHALLRSCPKPKTPAAKDDFPRLVAVSARTEEGVAAMLDKLESMPRDDDLLNLLHEIHSSDIPRHDFRGYTVLGASSPAKEVAEVAKEKRPVWFVFSGMGSQWPAMARQLMEVKVFEKSIRRCGRVLEPFGVNLVNILTEGTDETFSNVLNSFVGIVSVQVALVDTLAALGIQPDGMLGHSVGELGCAYADGAFTAEQTVLAAYWRGRVIREARLPPGAMAAVGLSWEEAQSRCPEDVYLACHNSADNVTVSGPVESVRQFVQRLQDEGVFAKEVDSSGLAFHSKYIAELGPVFRRHLDQLVPSPKPRSAQWVSSSLPEAAWRSPLAQLSSPAYHVNNLLSPVLFHEALAHVPDGAVVVEVAPHCLLQAILRRSLKPACVSVGLVNRRHDSALEFFLASLGRLFNAGLHPKLAKLYHRVKYPVGRGTPMISPLVQWDHSTEWTLAEDPFKTGRTSGQNVVEVNVSSEEYRFLLGHEIDGRLIFPAAGYMALTWKTLAKIQGRRYEEFPVVLEDIQFHRAILMPKDGVVKFVVNIFDGSGQFEVSESGIVSATGRIRPLQDGDVDSPQAEEVEDGEPTADSAPQLKLTAKEVYTALRLRGYDYSGEFRGIASADANGSCGELLWKNNWVCFIDCILQFAILSDQSSSLYLPARIQKAIFDTRAHSSFEKDTKVPLRAYQDIGAIKVGGVELRGMQANVAPKRQLSQSPPKLEKYEFVPYTAASSAQAAVEDADKELERALTVSVQVVLENYKGASVLKVAELAGNSPPEALLAPRIVKIVHGEPVVDVDLAIVGPLHEEYAKSEDVAALNAKLMDRDASAGAIDQNLHLVVAAAEEPGAGVLENLAASLRSGGFLLLRGPAARGAELAALAGLQLVSTQSAGGGDALLLMRKVEEEEVVSPLVVEVAEGGDLAWLEPLRSTLQKACAVKVPVLLLCQRQRTCGVLGLANCLKLEAGDIRCFFIRDEDAPDFSFEHPLYSSQLKKNLLMNVYQDGQWGSFRHILIDDKNDKTTLQVEHAYVNTVTRGDLSSLRWIEGPLSFYKPELNPGAELCHVYYAPLNFRDVMLATGRLQPDALPGNMAGQDCVLGTEFSGRDSRGRRVMGLMPARGMATSVLADRRVTWPVPDHWTLVEASTVPVAYCTSYYALIVRGRMKPGETLLVHAGSGGVGLASIAIALEMGVTVFTTVGSKEKREFLKSRFPQLTDRNIAHSRDTSFEQHVMRETGGKGVNLVLNSLAEDKLQASVRCLARHGRFLEIGKFDLAINNPLGMSMFLKNTTFHGILLDSLFDFNTVDDVDVVRLLGQGIESGAVKPLPLTVFEESQAEEAFRYLASGKHVGKVVLKIREEEEEKVAMPVPKLVAAIPKVYMNPEKVYVLVGGLGGFGLELAKWLVLRGASRLVLTSRSGLKTGYQSECVRRWREAGVRVAVSTTDCTTEDGAHQLLSQAGELGSVGGIFNLAAVLKDALLDNLSEEDFRAACVPKVDGTKSLDGASRRLCPLLDYFVTFSSVVCGRGNVGQTNYAMANSTMERICEERQADGLPGLAIQWGAVGDVGMLIDNIGDNNSVVGGTLPQRMSSCLASLDILLRQPHPVLASMVLADRKSSANTGNQIGLLDAVAKIMGVKDVKKINPKMKLIEMGMDSLMGAELKQMLERNYDITLSPQEIRTVTFGELLERSKNGPGAPKTDDTNSTTNNEKGHVHSLPELAPTELLLRLPSKAAEDSGDRPLFVVHPIDGTAKHLSDVAADLPMPVWGLQCTAQTPLSSIEDMAAFYLQNIQEVQPEGPYMIGGYSYGAMVAFEMGLQLEKLGKQTTLVMLDGSPGYITHHAIAIHNLQDKSNAENEARIMANVINLFTDIDYDRTRKLLETLPSWEERVARSVDVMSRVSPYSKEQLTEVTEALKVRMIIGDNYQPSGQFHGEAVLCRATDNLLTPGDDYGLSKICTQAPQVHVFGGNHKEILQGDNARRIADIIASLAKS